MTMPLSIDEMYNMLDDIEFAVLNTPYGIFVYDVSRLYEGPSQMGWYIQ